MGRALALVLIGTWCLLAQEPTTFKSEISLVELDASVFDGRGIIEGLQPQDFLVKDEGRPAALRYCVLEDVPLDLVLLIESSKMMAVKRVALRGAAEVAMAAARDGDRLGVMAFNDGARLNVPLSSDLKEVKRLVRLGLVYAAFQDKPYILTAVAEAAKYQAAEAKPHRRRAILMLGANAGFGTGGSHARLAADLWGGDTILAGVVIPTSWTRLINDQNPYHLWGMISNPVTFPREDYIDDVAALTGGEMIYAEAAGGIKQTDSPFVTLRDSIQRMRRRYRLYYDRPQGKPGQRRRVQVELSAETRGAHPEARIVAQKGYAIPKTDSRN